MITFDEQMKKVQEFTTRADFDPSIRLQFAPMIGVLKRAYDAEILAYEKRLHELEEQLKKAKPAVMGTIVEKKVDEGGVTVTAVLTDEGKKFVEGLLEEPAKPKRTRKPRKNKEQNRKEGSNNE